MMRPCFKGLTVMEATVIEAQQPIGKCKVLCNEKSIIQSKSVEINHKMAVLVPSSLQVLKQGTVSLEISSLRFRYSSDKREGVVLFLSRNGIFC